MTTPDFRYEKELWNQDTRNIDHSMFEPYIANFLKKPETKILKSISEILKIIKAVDGNDIASVKKMMSKIITVDLVDGHKKLILNINDLINKQNTDEFSMSAFDLYFLDKFSRSHDKNINPLN